MSINSDLNNVFQMLKCSEWNQYSGWERPITSKLDEGDQEFRAKCDQKVEKAMANLCDSSKGSSVSSSNNPVESSAVSLAGVAAYMGWSKTSEVCLSFLQEVSVPKVTAQTVDAIRSCASERVKIEVLKDISNAFKEKIDILNYEKSLLENDGTDILNSRNIKRIHENLTDDFDEIEEMSSEAKGKDATELGKIITQFENTREAIENTISTLTFGGKVKRKVNIFKERAGVPGVHVALTASETAANLAVDFLKGGSSDDFSQSLFGMKTKGGSKSSPCNSLPETSSVLSEISEGGKWNFTGLNRLLSAVDQDTTDMIEKASPGEKKNLLEWRRAMVGEVLTKKFASLSLIDGKTVSIPVDDGDKTSIVDYKVKTTHLIEGSLERGNRHHPFHLLKPLHEKDKGLNSILLFSGTNPRDIRSAVANLDPSGPARDLFERSKGEIENFLKGGNVQVMGYSQGGAMAMRTAVLFSDLCSKDPNKPNFTFNAPGTEQDIRDAYQGTATNISQYVYEGDPVSKVCGLVGDIQMIELPGKSGNSELEGTAKEKVAEVTKRIIKDRHCSLGMLEESCQYASVDVSRENNSVIRSTSDALQAFFQSEEGLSSQISSLDLMLAAKREAARLDNREAQVQSSPRPISQGTNWKVSDFAGIGLAVLVAGAWGISTYLSYSNPEEV